MNFDKLKFFKNKLFNNNLFKVITCFIITTIACILFSIVMVNLSCSDVKDNNNTLISFTSTTKETNISTITSEISTIHTDINQPVFIIPITTTSSNITSITTNTVSTTTTTIKTVFNKNIDELANEVIQGKWGNGEDRKFRLNDAGYNYQEVQNKVNEILNLNSTANEKLSDNNYDRTDYNTTDIINYTYVKEFSRGTYYSYNKPVYGGSGRSLIDCSYGTDNNVKGSIASSYLYNNYGYNYNDKRTMVYLKINGYESMNGYYYLDDSDEGNSEVIDFYYHYASNCPFQYQGIVNVSCYIVNY